MGKGIGNRRDKSCWNYRTTFEKALIISSLLPFLIVIVLVTFLLFQLNIANRHPNSCTTPLCQIEATNLAQRIDPSTNPCHDFYQFSCGNLWKNKNETSDPFMANVQESRDQILKVYSEPIKVHDHRLVKAAKILYKTCLNATEIKLEDYQFLGKILGSLGGWPVVSGGEWDETQFWWVRTTQHLRKSGLFYKSFIDVSAVEDASSGRYVLKVALPDFDSLQAKDFDDFVEIAAALGAGENVTASDYEEMQKFATDMRREISRRFEDDPPKKHTIRTFQNKYEFVHWKEFLKNLAGATINLREEDHVIFDSPSGFQRWFSFLANSTKRNQANYMIWKALEELAPYLTNKQQAGDEERPNFCIQEIRNRFSPSPLDIVYVQKHLPEVKIALAKDLVNNMKSEVMNLLEKCNWLTDSEKHQARERLLGMTQIIGAPGGYLRREVFYEMDVDMDEDFENEGFLSNLLRANRYHESKVYQQISKGKMLKWSLQTDSVIGDYYWEDNVINIPATVLQGSIFNEARPKYVNYGSIGMLLSHHFYRIIIGERLKLFESDAQDHQLYQKLEGQLSKCFGAQLNNTYLIDIVFQQTLGFQISYGAYKKSLHSKEDLGFAGYTANQLYWLSAASYFCQPGDNLFSQLFLSSLASNANFGEDFHCGSEPKKEKCNVF